MPLTAAQVQAQLADEAQLNRDQDQKPTIVHLELKFDGVAYDASQLYDALDVVYGTISSDKDTVTRGALQLTIRP